MSTPGDLLLHPVSVVALVLLLVNDQLLKARYPGAVTGKLSDFSGLVFFPLLVVSGAEAIRWLVRRDRWQLNFRAVVIATVVVGVTFAAVKCWYPAGELYRAAMGAGRWPFEAMASVARGDGVPAVERVEMVEDRTDLMALVSLAVAVWVGHRVMAGRVGVSCEDVDDVVGP